VRKILALLGISGLVLSSCAATPLVVQWTMPTEDNAASCGAPSQTGPIFAPNGLTAIIYWAKNGGPADSIKVNGQPGQAMTATLVADAAPGIYTKWSYVEKTVSGRTVRSCIGNTVQDTVTSKPDEIRNLR